jgi:hypothetical protein
MKFARTISQQTLVSEHKSLKHFEQSKLIKIMTFSSSLGYSKVATMTASTNIIVSFVSSATA